MRWPEVPPHLALNPPYFFVCFSFVKNLCRLDKGISCLFLSVSLCFSLAFFVLPLFQFLFLCLSLSLSFFSFFLPSCLSFLLYFGSLFCLFFCFFFLSSLLLFHERKQHQNVKLQSCFSSILSRFWFPILLCLWNPFFLPLLFPDFLLCFCSTSMFLLSKQTRPKTPIFGQEGGCNKTFFLWACVLQNVKSYRFSGGHFWASFGWGSKNTKMGISAQF